MSEFNITIESGTSKRLPIGNKWSPKDVVVTATGGAEDLDNVLTEQEALIAELQEVLRSKASGGSGIDTTIKDYVEGNLLEISNETVTKIRTRAFNYATNLTAVNFPNAESVSSYAFAECTGLISANLPNVTTATTTFLFDGCISLKSVNIPKVASVSNYAFRDCEALEKIEFGNISSIGSYSFSNAKSLVTVIIRREGTKATSLVATNAFSGTPIASGTGYVYVPSSLVDTFKRASNWSTYASQIRAIEDYPDITGGE